MASKPGTAGGRRLDAASVDTRGTGLFQAFIQLRVASAVLISGVPGADEGSFEDTAGKPNMRFFLACALAAALCCCSVSAANIEIDPSVLLSGTSDYSGTDGQARCQGMVNRANALTQSTIMFVPTLFWVSEVRAADATVNSQRWAPASCSPATVMSPSDTLAHSLSSLSAL